MSGSNLALATPPPITPLGKETFNRPLPPCFPAIIFPDYVRPPPSPTTPGHHLRSSRPPLTPARHVHPYFPLRIAPTHHPLPLPPPPPIPPSPPSHKRHLQRRRRGRRVTHTNTHQSSMQLMRMRTVRRAGTSTQRVELSFFAGPAVCSPSRFAEDLEPQGASRNDSQSIHSSNLDFHPLKCTWKKTHTITAGQRVYSHGKSNGYIQRTRNDIHRISNDTQLGGQRYPVDVQRI